MPYTAQPPQVAKLAPSKNKNDFFNRLNLSEESAQHRQVYAMMKEEASNARQRLVADPRNLAPKNGAPPVAPFSASNISETAMHYEVQRIFQEASEHTRPYYNLGYFTDGHNWDNWVIRWVLWHVFRYRDNRNRNRTNGAVRGLESPTGSPTGSEGSVDFSTYATSAHRSYVNPAIVANGTPTGNRYDPVRDL